MNSPRRRTSLRSVVPFPTVDLIKQILGIPDTDTSKDAAIAMVLASCLAMIENYCGRTFQEGDYTEEFPPLDARDRTLMLRAWPVQSITTVTRDGVAMTDYRLYADTGQLRQWSTIDCAFPSRPYFAYGGHWGHSSASVVVEYIGGYPDDAWPADLVDVVMRLFGERWKATGGTGNPADDSTGRGAIKGFAVDGVRIDYDLGDASTGAVLGVESGDVPPDLAPFAAQLEPYVDRRVYGA